MSVNVNAILELRRQFADEEITRKGYSKKIAELLEGIDEDARARFDALEKQLDEEEVTPKGYAMQLKMLF